MGAIALLGILTGFGYLVAGYYAWRGYIIMPIEPSPEQGKGGWALAEAGLVGYAGYLLWLTMGWKTRRGRRDGSDLGR